MTTQAARDGGAPSAAESTRAPSVREVAAAAGVSIGTVSNVLNRPEAVSPATRTRVEAAIARLGFVRNAAARQLRRGRSGTLGYVVLDVGNPFFTDVAAGIEDAVEAADMALVLCNSGGLEDRQTRHLARLQEQRIEGILATPLGEDFDALTAIAAAGTPVVLVDRAGDGALCSVSVDNAEGGRIAVDHLVALGHTAVTFVGGSAGVEQVEDRLRGSRAAHAEAFGPGRLEYLWTAGLTAAGGRAACDELLDRAPAQRPSAVVCANDLIALGLLARALERGLRVPDDLAIVGYDDLAFAEAAAVPLTSVRQPRQQMGAAAARMLLDEIAGGEHVHRQHRFEPQLVVRASTRATPFA